MPSPYENLPDSAFWRSAVATRSPLDPGFIYAPKLRITRKTRIVTAGSCFAQHVTRHLTDAGYAVQDAEPLNAAVPDSVAQRFGYRLLSARWGNVYTMGQMLQVAEQALGLRDPTPEAWVRDGRFYDAFRPGVEPEGLGSIKAVELHRTVHLSSVAQLLKGVDLFIFTLGLTESWVNESTGSIYPTAPGVLADPPESTKIAFRNFRFSEIVRDFQAFRKLVRAHNPRARFLLTVSPVPLTATASGDHVEMATAYSKAVLRAACGQLRDTYRDVDYFPSYEIITSVATRGAFFEANLRNVNSAGVATAMRVFLEAHAAIAAGSSSAYTDGRVSLPGKARMPEPSEAFCEDALLEAFAR